MPPFQGDEENNNNDSGGTMVRNDEGTMKGGNETGKFMSYLPS